ncbi:MAG: alanine dehydrogenase [Flavobacteriales bacterium]|nr:alanine dehydrogenase [Flavobacteriales bacterium]
MKFHTPFSKHELIPKEECLELKRQKGSYKIGIPKEDTSDENRVCLTPDAVSVLVRNGHQVYVESGAGLGSHFPDNWYSEAGAQIEYDKRKVFDNPIILKVQPPTLEEIEMMQLNGFLFSTLQVNNQCRAYFEHLNRKRITALSFEYLKDSHNQLSLLRMISEITGTGSILLASELLSSSSGGNGLLLGGITGVRPTEIVIIGAGTVGEFATRSALGLGASVRVFDNSITKLRRLQNQLGRISTSTLDPKELSKMLKRTDVLIVAIRSKDKIPVWITEEMVKDMKQGAVIIDISIDQVTCVETSEITTHTNPIAIKHGVVHYGVPNFTSRYARTTSKAISNFFLSYFLHLADEGNLESILSQDKGLKEGAYACKGRCTNRIVSEKYRLDYHDINLLLF